MKVSENELRDLLEDAEQIDVGRWRHGHTGRHLIALDGKHYAVWVQYHHDDGAQIFGDTELIEVVPVQKTLTVWEPVKP